MQDADVCIYEQSGLEKEFVALIVLPASQAQCPLGSHKGLTQKELFEQWRFRRGTREREHIRNT